MRRFHSRLTKPNRTMPSAVTTLSQHGRSVPVQGDATGSSTGAGTNLFDAPLDLTSAIQDSLRRGRMRIASNSASTIRRGHRSQFHLRQPHAVQRRHRHPRRRGADVYDSNGVRRHRSGNRRHADFPAGITTSAFTIRCWTPRLRPPGEPAISSRNRSPESRRGRPPDRPRSGSRRDATTSSAAATATICSSAQRQRQSHRHRHRVPGQLLLRHPGHRPIAPPISETETISNGVTTEDVTVFLANADLGSNTTLAAVLGSRLGILISYTNSSNATSYELLRPITAIDLNQLVELNLNDGVTARRLEYATNLETLRIKATNLQFLIPASAPARGLRRTRPVQPAHAGPERLHHQQHRESAGGRHALSVAAFAGLNELQYLNLDYATLDNAALTTLDPFATIGTLTPLRC